MGKVNTNGFIVHTDIESSIAVTATKIHDTIPARKDMNRKLFGKRPDPWHGWSLYVASAIDTKIGKKTITEAVGESCMSTEVPGRPQ
jgi:hypothetical protein